MIFPGSHQFATGGEWLVAASFMETSKLFALTVATIEPGWIETVAAELCKYSWSNAHWQKKSGRVIAEEQVALFGLIIATGRKVNFGKRHKKNMSEARDIFIQSALVAGELNGSYRFLEHNLALLQKWQDAEEKMRVRNIVCDDMALASFYSSRIPAEVYDQATLNRFLKKKRSQSFLYMQDEDVLNRRPEDKELVDYPPFFSIGSMQLRLEYHLEPGSYHDGVTYRLPADFAATVSPELFEWLVPGLLKEKLTVLLRALPKTIRKKLVPLSDTVNRLLDDLDFGSGSFYSAVEASILKQFKLLIRRSDWTDNLPSHLQPRFILFDAAGKELSAGRDLRRLLDGFSQRKETTDNPVLSDNDQKIIESWQESEHTTWDFYDLPKTVTTWTAQGEVAGFLYPAIIADPPKGCVRIAFLRDRTAADKLNKIGTLYLYRLHFAGQYKSLKKLCTTTLSGPSSLWLQDMGTTRKEVVDKMLDCILLTLFAPLPDGIIEKEHFFKKIKEIEDQGFYASAQKICHEIMALLRKRRAAQEFLTKIFTRQGGKIFLPADSKIDLQAHLNEIFPADFLTIDTLPPDFSGIDRQLQCFMIRLERFQANPGKDSQKRAQLLPYQNRLHELEAKKDRLSDEAQGQLLRFSGLVDEYRISLFSPEIKTLEPVSPQKLEQQWRLTLARC